MFRKKSIIVFCLMILVFGILLLPFNYTNAGDSIMGGLSNTVCQSAGDCKLNDFLEIFTDYSNLLLGGVGAIALLMFIYGGIVLLISAGNSEKVTQGKQVLIGAIIGIVIVFTSYMIIQFTMKSLGVVGDDGKFLNTDDKSEWNEAPK